MDEVLEVAAFDQIFDDYAADIFKYLARRLGDQNAADVTAEVFRLAIEGRTRYDPSRGMGVRPWLYGIAANLIRSHYRKEERQRRALKRLTWSAVPSGGFEFDDVDERLVTAEQLPIVLTVIDELSIEDRETLLLSVWEGLSHAEVAVALGIPEGTVKSRLNRVRKKIRERVDRFGQQASETRSVS